MPIAGIGGMVAGLTEGGGAAAAGGGLLGGLGTSLISGAGSIIGDIFGSSGQKAANAASLANQIQSENWMKQMSDTAMQRRVADLKAANLNPLLAMGPLGGASTPGVSPVQFQNAGASFNNLGGQISSAVGLQQQQSQISLNQAMAAKAQEEARNVGAQTDQVIPVQVRNIMANTDLTAAQAANTKATIDVIDAQWHYWLQEGHLAEGQAYMQGLDNKVREATMQLAIQAKNSESKAEAIGFENIRNASDSDWGRFMALFGIGGANTAAGIGHSALSNAARIAE